MNAALPKLPQRKQRQAMDPFIGIPILALGVVTYILTVAVMISRSK